ncbi:MAG: cyclic peptide export ABC transporter [Nitrospiraceae bacterium]
MNVSRFVRFLFDGAKPMAALMIVTGLIAGLSSVGLLAIINRLLSHSDAIPRGLAAAFIGLVVLKVLANWISQLLLVKFAQETILDIGIRLCRKVLCAPLRALERHGAPQLLATLTDDTGALAWSLQCIPALAINVATLVGCSLYLAWLSWPAFLGVTVLAVIGFVGYRELYRRFLLSNQAVRESRAALFGHFRGLTEGIKELMLNRSRREEFLSFELERTAHRLRDHNFAATKQYLSAEAWTQGLFYGLIGVTLLVFPGFFTLSGESLRGYVFAMLYMVAPMWGVIGMIPTLSRGHVALAKLEELGLELDGIQEKERQASTSFTVGAGQQRIDIRGAMFQYGSGNGSDRHFVLGPIDATFETGEVIFVIGGNGSGKSTFVKMLAGLYPPQRGVIRLNGEPVSASNQEWFRQHVSVIFSDFFLFKKLLGIDPLVAQRSATEWLRTLQMDHKVSIEDNAFSTVDLSQGQRKRLALVTALLEDRPFCVFDEWAADQDPHYKQIFYGHLLQDLRRRGKGVIVVTHDDRYFHLGDRVLKLEEGKLVECTESFVHFGGSRSDSVGQPLPES